MKRFVKMAFVAVFATTAGYGVYTSQKSEVMSDLALANVEALADNSEGGGGVSCSASVTCANGSVSCSGVSGCVSYNTYVKCCDSSGTAHYSYCGC